jgi:hypothetical protein
MGANIAEKLKGAAQRVTLEQIRAARTIKQKEIEVPEWGGYVTVRSLTQLKATRLQKETGAGTEEFDRELYQKRLLQMCMVYPTIPDDAAAEEILMQQSGLVQELIIEIEGLSRRNKTSEEREDEFRVGQAEVQHVGAGAGVGDDGAEAPDRG